MLFKDSKQKTSKKTKRNQLGVTLIEIMVVMAIAAVIISIVAVAITTAQRNNRNQQRASDRAYIKGEISTWQSNNSNDLPSESTETAQDGTTGTGYWFNGLIGDNKPIEEEENFSFYSKSDIQYRKATATIPAATTDFPTEDQLHIWIGSCNDDDLTTGQATAGKYDVNADISTSSRTLAFVFQNEGGDPTCEEV